MMMPGRSYSAQNGYRYGFNGKENDNEVKGDGNQQDYGMRIYDSRLGRFLSVDPLSSKYPWYSTYHFAGNSPIANTDLDGAEPKPTNTGRVEGQTQTTSETKYGLHQIPTTTTKTWYYHKGGAQIGQTQDAKGNIVPVLSQSGWYSGDEYLNLLSKTDAAKQLARNAYSHWVYPRQTATNELNKFIGQGLNQTATQFLNGAAHKIAMDADAKASGFTEPTTGINVEDIIFFPIAIGKVGLKVIGSVAARNIVTKMEATGVDDLVKLLLSKNEYDPVKTLYRGTTGSEGRGSMIFLTDDAAVAESYVKNGGQVMQYPVSNSAIFELQQRRMLTINPKDMHMVDGKQIYHTTYLFEGVNIRQALNKIATPVNK